MQVQLLGVPFNGDGTPPAAENPAAALRDAGLVARLVDSGHRVEDLGDLRIPVFSGVRDPATGVLNARAWQTMTDDLAAVIRGRLDLTRPMLVLGGDCAIMSGICSALRELPYGVGIVYLDGHADFRWPEESPSGEPADLVLTALTGRIPGLFRGVTRERPLAPDRDIAVFGFREWDRIAESDVAIYDQRRMTRLGLMRSVRDGLWEFRQRGLPAWVHFDVDVLDPAVMPAVLFPEWEGLSVSEAGLFLRAVFGVLPVLGVSVACYHPRRDADGLGARRVVNILAGALPAPPGIAQVLQ